MNDPKTLLVGDDAGLIRLLSQAVRAARGSSLEVVRRLEDAYSRAGDVDLALVIVHLREGEDIGRVAQLREHLVGCGSTGALLVVCDEYRVAQARDALLFGAIDYLPRPLDVNQVAFLIEMQVLRMLRQRGKVASARAASSVPLLRGPGTDEAFLYAPDTPAAHVAEIVRRVAPLASTVLLGGETGTGKSRMARQIHNLSPRRELPFLVVNCGALSSTLIESEMFGHVKGAFTGADAIHVGKFAAAGEGTLFLDEIDTIPPPTQAKLLRAVEERVFEPVGSNRTQPMHARLIVASNRPLDQEVREGRFRSDLFFRLNVISLELPPLRSRGQAVIEALSREFLALFAGQMKRKVVGTTPEALGALAAYHWPGNVRELRNVIERGVALSVGEVIDLDDLPDHIAAPTEPDGWRSGALTPDLAPYGVRPPSKEESERAEEVRRITDALERHGNNRRRAAAELGISRMTLYNKLHKYHLETSGAPRRHPSIPA